jgi:hypothetical protein
MKVPIPEGEYVARAVSGEYGNTKSGGEMVAVVFEFTRGELEGHKITWYGYFTEKTSQRTVESLRHAGCTFASGDITDLAGLGETEVRVVVEHEHDDRGPRARIRWVNALAASAGGIRDENKMSVGDKRAFAARMKGLLLATGAPAPRPAAPKAAPPRQRVVVEEPPF